MARIAYFMEGSVSHSAVNRVWWFASYWLPVIAWVSLIFVLSCLPSSSIDSVQDVLLTQEKYLMWLPFALNYAEFFVHPVEFAVLAALVYRLLASYQTLPWRYALGGTLLFAVGYGLVGEFYQSFVPGRDASLSDVALDWLGAALGLTTIVIATRLGKHRRRTSGQRALRAEVRD